MEPNLDSQPAVAYAARVEATDRFAFGENWRKFNASLTEEQRAHARASLIDWFGDLSGRTFLDIGAGSGLFAVVAAELGAKVRAFDYDPANEAIERGDVLDSNYMDGIGEYDIVYSWGVLHHTGAMWDAIENAVRRVKPGGVALLALYTRPAFAPIQIGMKRAYNASPGVGKLLIRTAWATAVLAERLLRRRENPLRYIREYPARSRGMTFWRDVEDWAGGWPFEYTDASEFRRRLPAGFVLESVKVAGQGGCSEYLIARA
jgi:SAM-dependent methyltransferase